MKSILLAISFLSASAAAFAQNKLIINGSIQGMKAKTIIYVKNIDNTKSDSAIARDGKFVFDLQIPSGDIYFLQAGKDAASESASLLLYLQAGELNITGKGPLFRDAALSGSQFVTDFNSFNEMLKDAAITKTTEEIMKKYNDAVSRNNMAMVRQLDLQLAKSDTARALLAEGWVSGHPGSAIDAFLIYLYMKPFTAMPAIESLFSKLSPEAKDNAVARKIQNSIENYKLTAVGMQALDFTQNDPQGNQVSLSGFSGKYVLVDFWASWCGPCRDENPNLVKAYNKYKAKNFTIVGVSLDKDKAKWLAAIKKDGLEWTQVSDLKYWENDVAKQYDIGYVPANMLVDPKGKIIAKNIRGEELVNKLKEIFGN